ncbi:MAG: tRNA lysidine(34) synthetase TilS [Ruminococcus sp.]|nr:tRNA lysidine(34) synthetase TilS [Ruminococcus sp.]
MLDKILNFAEKYNMLSSGKTIICGLSGGADSVCLAYTLDMLGKRKGFNVEAIHVNHCLRGEESDRDEIFCREFCDELGIELTVVSCNVREYAERNSLSTEEAARILRYRAFEENSVGKLIATAHNANDNLETVIFNLARGSALKGITGIPPVRGNIIRPLLTVTRTEIEEFLSENGINYVTDSSNLSDDYTRNRIRHNILPQLAEINRSAVKTSVSSLDALREENSFIESETDKAYNACRFGDSLKGLSEFHPVIRKRCIARLLTEKRLPYSHDRLEEIDVLTRSKGKINLSGNIYAVSDGNCLSVKKISKPSHVEISAEFKLGSNSIFEGRTLTAELIRDKDLAYIKNVNTNLVIYLLDYDKIIGRAVIRNRRFGDKIKLIGRDFTSSVKKLISEKIPPECRDTLHFIEDEQGTILAEGLGVAQCAAPDENTVNYLKISISDD